MALGAKTVSQNRSKMLVELNSIFCAIYFMLALLCIAQIVGWEWLLGACLYINNLSNFLLDVQQATVLSKSLALAASLDATIFY